MELDPLVAPVGTHSFGLEPAVAQKRVLFNRHEDLPFVKREIRGHAGHDRRSAVQREALADDVRLGAEMRQPDG